MLPRERMLAAMNLKQPDRVPVWEMGFNEESIINIAKHFTSNLPPLKHVSDMTMEEKIQLFEGIVTIVESLDLDGVTLLPLGPREHAGENLIRDGLGIVYRLSDHGEPFPIGGPIKDASNMKGFSLGQPNEAELIGLQFAKQRFEGKRALVFLTPGPFRLSWGLRGGMEHLLADYLLEPKLAHSLARIVTDYYMEFHSMAIDAGAEIIALEGDLAFNTNTLMSPAQYAEFLGPYHKEIVDNVHRKGAKIFKHSDGNLWPILDMLLDCGFDGIHPIQPQCMDIGEVKQHLRGKACVMGNIDCMYVLPDGTTEEVEQTVKETIKKAAPGGGYIMSSSNSVHPGCKAENYITMVHAARKYGAY
jgi:uroporphyrinogen decarboxylase